MCWITIGLTLASLGPPAPQATPGATVTLDASRYGLKVELPAGWTTAVQERDEYVFVARVPQADPNRPGACACELGLAPESLEEYRTRIEARTRDDRRAGTLVRNELVPGAGGRPDRLETLREFRPDPATTWRERSVRIVANRQLYQFVLNVDEATWPAASAAFDRLIDGAVFKPPDTGADRVADAPKEANRWVQREFKFALDLPEEWLPALAPDGVALLFADGPARGIWADNLVVLAHPAGPLDLERLMQELPDGLRAIEPNAEVLYCRVVRQGQVDALETVVRTRRGPFSMTVLERRFRGERFNYEVKYTVESERFELLSPTLRRSLDSFREVPGEVPAVGGKPA